MSTTYQISSRPALKLDENINAYNFLIIPIDTKGLSTIANAKNNSVIKFINNINNLQKKTIDEGFAAREGQTLEYTEEIQGEQRTSIFIGLGATDELKGNLNYKMELCGGVVADILISKKPHIKPIIIPGFFTVDQGSSSEEAILNTAFGFGEKFYRFSRYLTTEKSKEKLPKISQIAIAAGKSVKPLLALMEDKLESIYLARDLCNEPANILYPETYAEIINEQLKKYKNIEVQTFNEDEMDEIGMHMLLGVGLGSDKESRLVVMKYCGNPGKQETDIALVGKGITFDTGGLNIKPSRGMEDMKDDMAGSAAVFATIKLLAARNAKVNVVGVVALVENAINGSAQRPGDVVKSLSGQTVEIMDTDAEGRLVLGDAIYYADTIFKPRHIIDLATLTGAIVVALGKNIAGAFSNSDELAMRLTISGKKVGEPLWRLPMTPEYDKMMNSDIADVKNISGGGPGSITAAQFLQRFIGNCKSWAHLDIAGVAFDRTTETPLATKGARGFGVKLLDRFIADHIETEEI